MLPMALGDGLVCVCINNLFGFDLSYGVHGVRPIDGRNVLSSHFHTIYS